MTRNGKENGALPAYAHGLKSGSAYDGMSKRELIASMALQGILSNKSIHKYTIWTAAQSAVMYADQMLQCLEKDAGEDGPLNISPEQAGVPQSGGARL